MRLLSIIAALAVSLNLVFGEITVSQLRKSSGESYDSVVKVSVGNRYLAQVVGPSAVLKSSGSVPNALIPINFQTRINKCNVTARQIHGITPGFTFGQDEESKTDLRPNANRKVNVTASKVPGISYHGPDSSFGPKIYHCIIYKQYNDMMIQSQK